MADKSKKASLLRKVFVLVALIALLGFFLTLYYFVYIPQQETAYNKSTFRILKEISENFTDRVEGVDTANQKSIESLNAEAIPSDTSHITDKLIKEIEIPSERKGPSPKTKIGRGKSASDLPGKSGNQPIKKTLAEILQPIIDLHAANFESVILINPDSSDGGASNKGKIIYNSAYLSLDDAVNIDSIYKKNAFFIYPVTVDIDVESVKYKLFILPFHIKKQRFVIGGFISNHDYKINSRRFPVLPLMILAVLLVIILSSLPFLKVFLLSSQESISVRDVRSIIAMIYIIPFIFIILVSSAWLHSRAGDATTNNIRELHNQVAANFYKEINDVLEQLKYYNKSLQKDSIIQRIQRIKADASGADITKIKLKDAALHPMQYKNLDGLFWIDQSGQEIAKWNFVNDTVLFFQKKDRQYVKDLQNHEGYVLPRPYAKDTFSIQPIRAKSSGEYTVSIVTPSTQHFEDKKAIMAGLSAKMYSVFKPVVPKGLNFCIIDQPGKILYHSESARNLQENIFEEVRNGLALKIAVNHKDSTLLDLKLYEKDVTLLITPLEGLPYYLITYAYKRDQFLHIFHIEAFTFLTESLLLLLIALLSLFFYYSNNKFSKLFFAENDMEFTKPSQLKEEYYKNLFSFHITILVVSVVMSLVFTGKEWLFFVLNLSIQFPLFSIISYYLLRCLENNCEIINASKRNAAGNIGLLIILLKNKSFRKSIGRVLVPYVFITGLFQLNKDTLFNTPHTSEIVWINGFIILLEILVPVLAISIKIFGIPFLKKQVNNKINETSFQHYFIRALLLSAVMTTILPVIGVLLYAGNQEKMLQLKSRQMYESQKIQERRSFVNAKADNTKLHSMPGFYAEDSIFIDSLKYAKSNGLYTGNDSVYTDKNWNPTADSSFADYGLYKAFTQFLFLPPDHPDFFNSRDYYYYWRNISDKGDSAMWNFHYRNTRDYKDPSHLVISSKFKTTPTTFSLFKNSGSILLLFIVILFVYIFYNILFAVSKRLFLIGYFEHSPGKEQDENYVNNKYFKGKSITDPFELDFWKQSTLSMDVILRKENQYENTNQRDEAILKIQTLLADEYLKIWNDLPPSEKFALYDLAMDGFTNYKNIDTLYSLYKKGLLKKKDHHLTVMNKSFSNYLATKSGGPEITKLKEDISEGGNWGNIRTVLLVITLIVVVFLFVVQEDLSKRVLAIATSLGALIPLMLKVFSKNNEGTTAEKK